MVQHDDEMYQLICKDRFDKIVEKQDETLRILRGENGDTGLISEVKDLKRAYGTIKAGIIFILAAIAIQIISFVFEFFK